MLKQSFAIKQPSNTTEDIKQLKFVTNPFYKTERALAILSLCKSKTQYYQCHIWDPISGLLRKAISEENVEHIGSPNASQGILLNFSFVSIEAVDEYRGPFKLVKSSFDEGAREMFNLEMAKVSLHGHGDTVCLAGTDLSTGELRVKLLEGNDKHGWRKRRLIEKENGLPQKSYRGLVNVAMGKDMLLIVLAQQSYRYKQKYGWTYKGYLFDNKGK